MHILIIGLGFSGTALATASAAAGLAVTITSRQPGAQPPGGVALLPFAEAATALATATHLVLTAAPGEQGDPMLALHGPAVAAAPHLRWIGYMSTTGVYGDRGGGWVEEATPPSPSSERGRRRVAAEQAWIAAGVGRAVDIFRLAGIYGPGRSVLDDLRAGNTRRVSAPGHAFGRIHRDDIAGAVLAAIRQDVPPGVRLMNLSDDEPAESADVIAYGAGLLGLDPPPLTPLADALAGMSPMARTFWADNRKVRSERTQQMLGRRWLYPTYREGLRAVLTASHPRAGE